ncbi:MAG: hypothetical protein KDC58_05805 [Cyclobacteriaceae bacterium]|nr:hypothetical protein [Cyclobacteriaceae bacterium]
MKKPILCLILLTTASIMAKAQNEPFCKLKGTVYQTPTKQGADYWVYVEDSEAFADMLVYLEENKLYADEPGVWFFVENKGLADYAIFFTKDKSEADFSIYCTDSPTFAGCK